VARQAGHKTAYRFLADLAIDCDVDLLILCKSTDLPLGAQQDEELRRVSQSIQVVPVTRMQRFFALLVGLASGLAPRLSTRLTSSGIVAVRRAMSSRQYDLLWLEFSQTFWVSRYATAGTEVVMSAHDVQTQLVASKGGVERLLLLGLTYASEKSLFAAASRIRVQSRNDEWLLHTFFKLPRGRIEVVGPELSDFVRQVSRSLENVEPYSLIFWGALGREENSVAIVEFVRESFSTLQGRFPAAKLYIVGSSPPEAVLRLASSSIVVTGFVDDPSPYFEKASIGIAPLLAGAGIKVKVLEMLGVGMPVVSTPIGAEGIDESRLLNVVPVDTFVDAISKCWAETYAW
jgi:glycosyltransferase involved in cell wall biosynthesis